MVDEFEVRDFDEIADAQEWSRLTMLNVVRDFISSRGLGEALDDFAEAMAGAENAPIHGPPGYCPACRGACRW